MNLCKCGQPASHTMGDKRMCCDCYVREGNPPADWHAGCMRTWKSIKKAINIRESILVGAWTSRDVCVKGTIGCPPVNEAKCFYRYFDGNPLECNCRHTGSKCPILLAGQKFCLEDVR